MKITVSDYFRAYENHPEITPELTEAAAGLLEKVDALLQRAEDDGVVLWINPSTRTYVSGQQNGGWRPADCPVGAANSKHKKAHAVDVYDPENELDQWCVRNTKVLEELGLYLEAGTATPRWCHIQDQPPGSGRRFFNP